MISFDSLVEHQAISHLKQNECKKKPVIRMQLLKDNNYLLTTTDGAVNATACPYCRTGKLVIRQHTANGSQFLGCSHYPSCNQTFKDLEILKDKLMCPDCQSGFMVKRKGKFGDFLGCTNYPGCTNTIKLR